MLASDSQSSILSPQDPLAGIALLSESLQSLLPPLFLRRGSGRNLQKIKAGNVGNAPFAGIFETHTLPCSTICWQVLVLSQIIYGGVKGLAWVVSCSARVRMELGTTMYV